jgi:hypothetical protein
MQTLSEIKRRVIGSRPSGGPPGRSARISGRVDQALLEQGVGIRRVNSVQDLFEVIQSDLRGGMKNP